MTLQSGPGQTGDIESPNRSVGVIANVQLAPNVYYLEVDARPKFEAGQCLAIGLDGVERYYSIASAPGAGNLSVLYDVVAGGALTPRLARLGRSDTLRLSAPFGTFVPEARPMVWIAVGTGIAPFLSMARGGFAASARLLHGSRTPEGLYFYRELEGLMGRRYVPCLSQADGEGEIPQGAYRGRLTLWLREHDLDLSCRYYLCGSAGMVVDVRDLLVSKGVGFDNILSEIYF